MSLLEGAFCCLRLSHFSSRYCENVERHERKRERKRERGSLTSVVDSGDGVSVQHPVEEGVRVFREL